MALLVDRIGLEAKVFTRRIQTAMGLLRLKHTSLFQQKALLKIAGDSDIGTRRTF